MSDQIPLKYNAVAAKIGRFETADTIGVSDGGTGAANAETARTNLGVAIGSNVQAHSVVLGNTTASYTTSEETKLSNIAIAATANNTDANLLNRANHTGTQSASTIDSGVFDIARIPATALERMTIVADQTARYALTIGTVQNGDSVKQTDTGILYLVVNDANLDGSGGYQEYTAGSAASVPWSGITSRPSKVDALVKNKFDATAAPAVVNDTTQGYSVGSEWVDVTNDNAYTCVDASTSAAVWSAGGGGAGVDYTNTVVSQIGATITLDLNLGDSFTTTLTGDVDTITISNPPPSGEYRRVTWKIVQAATPRSITWPASIEWVRVEYRSFR